MYLQLSFCLRLNAFCVVLLAMVSSKDDNGQDLNHPTLFPPTQTPSKAWLRWPNPIGRFKDDEATRLPALYPLSYMY